jgi:hypothetical protein
VNRPAQNRPAPSAMAGRTVFVVLIAAGLGLLVLNNAYDDGGGAGSGAAPTTSTSSSSTVASSSTSAAPGVQRSDVKVIVANASGVAGSAGKFTTNLAALGYTTLPATNASASGQATTKVYHLPANEAGAQMVATDIGAAAPTAWPTTNPPVKDIGAAQVVIVLGQDLANTPPTTGASATTPPPTT